MSILRTFPVFAAGVLALQGLGVESPTAPAVPAADRPLVLMLPGRGFQVEDTAALRKEWSDALGDGLSDLTGHRVLREDDFRLVWYADALQDDRSEGCRAESPGSSRSTPGWARDVGSTLASAGALMMRVAAWMGGPEGEALRALGGDLAYLGDEDRRCRAERRLAAALREAEDQGRPVVLVAHSFGALVGYHHLRSRAAGPRVERFVTVGSLLGHRELRMLLLGGDGAGALPDGVGSWVNVRDPRDPLSAPLSGPVAEQDGVEDRVTKAKVGRDPHDPARYLLDPATAEAVLTAWCGAAAAAGPACEPAPAEGRP